MMYVNVDCKTGKTKCENWISFKFGIDSFSARKIAFLSNFNESGSHILYHNSINIGPCVPGSGTSGE
jgi:hypothetical protein